MTARKWKALAVHAVVALSGTLGGALARADSILEANVMVTMSSVPRVQALGITAPGTLTVTVTDLGWTHALQSLSFAITSVSGVLTSRAGAGTLIYDVLTPTNLFANLYALPNTSAGAGLYHITASFAPTTPPVPLPAAFWLLFSGVSGLAALRRKHATVTNSVVQ